MLIENGCCCFWGNKNGLLCPFSSCCFQGAIAKAVVYYRHHLSVQWSVIKKLLNKLNHWLYYLHTTENNYNSCPGYAFILFDTPSITQNALLFNQRLLRIVNFLSPLHGHYNSGERVELQHSKRMDF